MKVRDLNASDIPQLMALDAATNSHPWDISHWQHSLKADVCLGIDGSTELAAFAVAMKMVDEAELLLIAVQPNLQGKGVGQIIFNTLTQKLTKNGAQSLFLEVRESNSKARRFYESAGFAETGIRPAYYPAACGAGREDALIFAMMMSKA
ncbi:ribosomal protein S18-alanine N-acetyltransferase [Iodobacter sp. HSC-16F04]|uniref:[Ribosomal protein bS18]-alanine N-acetyltransferase n=1 Tax=Iodobacter violaceini TaxID=3044271 RepID=A0ABX0KUP6_9NEIS|nr:ribosomal protein S18-alanine N-acetyltransferase [Iodobacter violacea]NHQ88391.1 ribosomal protein S18-alanine N-acetyltransferase [Iodobacter violacea]